nr:3A protein [parechovirus C1]
SGLSPLDSMDETIASLERRFGQISNYIRKEIGRCTDDLIEEMEDYLCEYDTPFQCFERKQRLRYATAPENIKQWVKKHMVRLKDFLAENKGWFLFFSILSTFLSVLTLVYLHYRSKPKEPEKQE